MKKRAQSRPDKEHTKLKTRTALRERQFQIAVRALKNIVEFQSAHLSVFESEVHELQRTALDALCLMETLQRGKGVEVRALSGLNRLVYAKRRLNDLYGRFAGLQSPGPQSGREVDD